MHTGMLLLEGQVARGYAVKSRCICHDGVPFSVL